MNLSFDIKKSIGYKSIPQRVRVMSEDWVNKNLFCPSCISFSLRSFPNNNPIGDFYCNKCYEDFELKSKKGEFGNKVVDGAYNKMIERISEKRNPNFLFLSYTPNYCVENLFVVPKHFIIPQIIEIRTPLTTTARRAGWIGCNILFSNLPRLGIIEIIKDSTVFDIAWVNEKWKEAYKLINEKDSSKGWLFEILNIIGSFEKNTFSLEELYKYEKKLSEKFPNNKNIKPKIRQQLQKLRDVGLISFLGNGKYYYPGFSDPKT